MGRPSTAARRYAEAAFEIADRDGTLDDWRDGLATASQVLGAERVAEVVDNPARPLAQRADIADRILADRVPPKVRNLVRLLVDRGSVDVLPGVATEYGRLLNKKRGIVEALVTSAVPLDDAEMDRLREKLGSMTGDRIELSVTVDGSLIGGLTVRLGDQLLDASVRGRLERLRNELATGSRSAH